MTQYHETLQKLSNIRMFCVSALPQEASLVHSGLRLGLEPSQIVERVRVVTVKSSPGLQLIVIFSVLIKATLCNFFIFFV